MLYQNWWENEYETGLGCFHLLALSFGGKFVSFARDLWHGIQLFSVYFGAGESQSLAQESELSTTAFHRL